MRLFLRPCKVPTWMKGFLAENKGKVIEVIPCTDDKRVGITYNGYTCYIDGTGIGICIDNMPEEQQKKMEQYSKENKWHI